MRCLAYRVLLIATFFLTLSAGPAFSEGDVLQAQLLAQLERSAQSYDSLKDYKAFFYKSERSDGGLEAREKIFLKFEKPFKVFMRWMDTGKKDLEVVYERGKHDGKLAIHKPGFFFLLKPVLFLDQNSPWVREGSASYDIEDVGIGTFLKDFSAAVKHAVQQKELKTQTVGDSIETVFLGSKEDPVYFAHRVVVGFDKGTELPTRMALYDWDDQPMGIYAYEDVSVNVGPDDKEFESLIHPKLFKVYRGVE